MECSRKTLYRYMNKGLLPYRRAVNNRRYISETDIKSIKFPQHGAILNGELNQRLLLLEERVYEQQEQIEILISLYKPKSFSELARKYLAKK